MLTLALAVAPTIAILIYILYRDKFDREPAGVLFVSFLFGVLSTLPAVGLEMAAGLFGLEETITGTVVFVFFGVALVEEFVKFVPLRFYSFTRRSFDEPLDGIVHGVMIGLGFATLENILYVMEGGIGVAIARMFLSVPGHAAYGAIMGYFFGKAKFNYKKRVPLLLTGLLLATFFHGLYDSCLFVTQKVTNVAVQVILVLGALTTDILAFVFAFRLIRQHRVLSKKLYRDKPVCTIRPAGVDDIPLIQTLSHQIWPPTYQTILSRKQITFMMQQMYSRASLRKQFDAGHQFFVVHNASIPIGFASICEVEPTVFKLHKIYLLPKQQGRGTGRFTIEQLIGTIQPIGATALRLNVNRHNKARGFYEKLGFAVTGEQKIEIGSGFFMDDYVMEKKLVVVSEEVSDFAQKEEDLLLNL